MSTFSEATTGNCGKSFWTDYEQTTDIRIRQPFYYQRPRFEKISLNTFQLFSTKRILHICNLI